MIGSLIETVEERFTLRVWDSRHTGTTFHRRRDIPGVVRGGFERWNVWQHHELEGLLALADEHAMTIEIIGEFVLFAPRDGGE